MVMKNVTKKIQKIPYLFFLLLLSCLPTLAQNGVTVKGTVLDGNGETVIGASIVMKGNNSIGTISDIDGNFTLSVPHDNVTLVVSFIGMTTQEVKATAQKPIRVVLEDDSQQLEEVVVVGFGQQKKASVVGAIAQTNSKALERTGGVTSLGQALTGNLPGVVTMTTTGKPGDEDPKITIRGVTSWNSSDPLVLVDGVERPMNSVDINFAVFNRYLFPEQMEGFFFTLFAIGVSACETAVAIAIIINIYRNIRNIQVQNLNEMKH